MSWNEGNWAHQSEGKARIWDARRRGARAVLAVAPPGAGKTRVMIQMCREEISRGGSVSVFVHRKMLHEQMVRVFSDAGVPFGVQAAGHHPDFEQPVQICMLDTVHTRCVRHAGRSDWSIGEPSLVFVDEAHKQVSKKAVDVFVGGRSETSTWDGYKKKVQRSSVSRARRSGAVSFTTKS